MDTMPIDMSLRAPRPERLNQLCQELYGASYAEVEPAQRARTYELALKEMEVSALSVVAQFCARMAGG